MTFNAVSFGITTHNHIGIRCNGNIMPLGILFFGKMPFIKMQFGIMALVIRTFSMAMFSITILRVLTFSITTLA
jgi:hypothetical protein